MASNNEFINKGKKSLHLGHPLPYFVLGENDDFFYPEWFSFSVMKT